MWVQYDTGKQSQRKIYPGKRSLVEKLAGAYASPDVAAMEFLRLRIDGEDVDLWFSRHESRHVLPHVTADGTRRYGALHLGHLGERPCPSGLLHYGCRCSLSRPLDALAGSVPAHDGYVLPALYWSTHTEGEKGTGVAKEEAASEALSSRSKSTGPGLEIRSQMLRAGYSTVLQVTASIA